MGRKKKHVGKLPNKIIVIPNLDKSRDEQWHTKRNMANFPSPFRMIITGGCGSGKTNTIKNIILRQYPYFDRILLCHLDVYDTEEYLDMGLEEEDLFDKIPPMSEFDGEGKTLLIIEELEFNTTRGKHNDVSKIFRYYASHKHLSVILSFQDFFSVPTICRRVSNIFVCYKTPDKNQLNAIGKKVGLNEKGELLQLIKEFCPLQTDSLCFDLTKKTPYPIRKNIFQNIRRMEQE